MLTIQNTFTFPESYPLSRLGDPETTVFFDIETTGFSGDYHQVYLIGCTWYADGLWQLIQWFADTKEAEKEILTAFLSFLSGFHTLVHFNGDTFDIPFLKKRIRALGLLGESGFEHVASVDIYKRVKPFKKHLGLLNLKQKSLERFLGVDRKDLFSGGELIQVYEDYLKRPGDEALHLLLLHNEDDLKGMPKLLPILYYPDFFSQDFRLLACREVTPSSEARVLLTACGDPDTQLPVPLRRSLPSISLLASGSSLTLSIRLYEGTLKYFYPNYKDYYYLIFEDTAIHKSVGEFVDKDARIKATPETCYTKKTGVFLPQPEPLFLPEFKNSCKEKSSFFEYGPDCFSDEAAFGRYVRLLLNTVLCA